MKKNFLFLSCDWGTSSFRLRLVETPVTVLAEESNAHGITSAYALWCQSGKPEGERLLFYQTFLFGQIQALSAKLKRSLAGVPLVLSGMASSTIGMLELPYKQVPFLMDASDLQVKIIDPSAGFPHKTILVSGTKSDDDVMRGEEIQLIGCEANSIPEAQLFLFPGTHSKHIAVSNGVVTAFQTYMTGEMFELLSTKSILSVSINNPGDAFDTNHQQCFSEGVIDSINMNPLHAFFLVRTNQLLGKMSKEENYYYLSGLLIGMELKEIFSTCYRNIHLVTNDRLMPYYRLAFDVLELSERLRISNVDTAIIRGHYRIYQLYGSGELSKDALLIKKVKPNV